MRQAIIVTLLTTLSLSLFADDLYAPNWRGHERWTYQQWEFGTDEMNPLPDVIDSPFNPRPAQIIPAPGHGYIQELNGRTGIWPLSGEIWIPIENFPEPLDEKRIWIQVTWADKGVDPLVVETCAGIDQSAQMIIGIPQGQVMDLGNGWYHSTFEIILNPNPAEELVHIFGSVYVDEVVIDTICIPEPTTLVLLGLGCCLLRKRKR